MKAASVGITLFRRPEYTARVLSALEQCYGLEDRTIYLSIDWDGRYTKEIEAVSALAQDFAGRHPRANVTTHSAKLGIDVHKEWLIDKMLADGNDRFVFLEDDTLPAKDALHYFDWALDRFQQDADAGIVSVCGYRKMDALEAGDLGQCYRARMFVPWGWAMWADRWRTFWSDGTSYRRDIAAWFGAGESPNGRFDYWWDRKCKDLNLQSIFPSVSRMFNFGRERGEHTHPEIFDRTDYNPVGAWQIEDLPDRTEWVESQPRVTTTPETKPRAMSFLSFMVPRDGYGISAIQTARALRQVAPEVEIVDMRADEGSTGGFVLEEARRWSVNGTAILLCAAEWLEFVDASRRANFTMFESTRLLSSRIQAINRYADLCVVPCQWNREIFHNNGITVPIAVVGLGVNVLDWPLLERQRNGAHPYTFLWSGTGDLRKGWDLVYRAFHAAGFGGRTDVQLVMHFRNLPKGVTRCDDKNVTIHTGSFSDAVLRMMLERADCYVFPSRGEGWGLPPREAAATGLPVIATNFGGLAEGIAHWAIPLQVQGMSKADYGFWDEELGVWAEPDLDHLVASMQWCFEHQAAAAAFGQTAAAWLAEHQTWERTARELLHVTEGLC